MSEINSHLTDRYAQILSSFLENMTDYPVLILNTEVLDFVSSRSDYDFIKHLFSEEYVCENHHLYF